MQRKIHITALATALVLSACILPPHGHIRGVPVPPLVPVPVPVPHHHPKKVSHIPAPLPPLVVPPHPQVVIPIGHVHGPSCGHYFHSGAWYVHSGHIHGKGCGHKWHGGKWILL